MVETIQAIVAIVLIDLTLSGDNAIVIGMAARALPPHRRRQAIVFGGMAAVGVRVVFAAAVTLLLQVPYLQLVAGIVLVIIAYRMVQVAPNGEASGHAVRSSNTMRGAIATILIADVAMGSDNIIGVGAAAHGSIPLLLFGLGLSIPIVLFGSALIVRLLDRFPYLIWLGAFALIWTAAEMIIDEPGVELEHMLPLVPEIVLAAVLLLVVVSMRGAMVTRQRRSARRRTAESAGAD